MKTLKHILPIVCIALMAGSCTPSAHRKNQIFNRTFTFIKAPAIHTITSENNNERHNPGTPAHKKAG